MLKKSLDSHNYFEDKFILSLIENVQDKTVLDLGSGFGIWAWYLRTHFENSPLKITGVDYDENNIKILEKMSLYDVLHQYDVKKISDLKLKADIVIASHLIEHLDKKDGFKLIEDIKKIGTDLIIINCPYGVTSDKTAGHISDWFPSDFHKAGLKTRVLVTKGVKSRLVDLIGRAYYFVKGRRYPLENYKCLIAYLKTGI